MTAPSAFWRFSLDFYARPGAAEACLALQDEAAADIDILLYLLFLAATGREVGDADAARLDAAAAPWREAAIAPLRRLRRRLKTEIGAVVPPAAFRGEVQRLEIEAERIAQEAMERLLPPPSLGGVASSPEAAARANLAAYGAHLGGLPAAPVAALLRIFAATAEPMIKDG
jgi:uncharacterized protein (TIGR02444 family)